MRNNFEGQELFEFQCSDSKDNAAFTRSTSKLGKDQEKDKAFSTQNQEEIQYLQLSHQEFQLRSIMIWFQEKGIKQGYAEDLIDLLKKDKMGHIHEIVAPMKNQVKSLNTMSSALLSRRLTKTTSFKG